MRRALGRRPSVEAERAAHAYVAILIAEAHVQQIDVPAFGLAGPAQILAAGLLPVEPERPPGFVSATAAGVALISLVRVGARHLHSCFDLHR